MDQQKLSKPSKRCATCGKKMNKCMRIIGLCRCGNVYCSLHRTHECPFDYSTLRKTMTNVEKAQIDII